MINSDFPLFVFPYTQKFSSEQETALLDSLKAFLSQWKAHDSPLKADAWVEEGQFLLIEVDSFLAVPSGCSKDKLYLFVKNLNKNLGLEESPLNLFFIKVGNEMRSMTKIELKKMWENDDQISECQLFPIWISSRNQYDELWGKPAGNFQTLLMPGLEKSIFQK
ncbi:MAG TPA: hypothetical protein PKY12_07635 [Catalimonadaceae bacterium]|nr:hypothetical protein [Catalimonadaceae bacterium]